MKRVGCARFSLPFLVFAFVLVFGANRGAAATYYVNSSNAAPEWPYTNWSKAAQHIQDAITAASAGSTVLVAAGQYNVGSYVPPGFFAATRVVIRNPLTLKSVSGRDATFIVGQVSTGLFGCGSTAIRCLTITASNVHVVGFTFTNGHTRTGGGRDRDMSGGGIYVESNLANVVVQDCRFVDCAAAQDGGAGFRGVYTNCEIMFCRAWNGGGLIQATAMNCRIAWCRSSADGGGIMNGQARDTLIEMCASSSGGGGTYAQLLRCTVLSCTGHFGGGLYYGRAESSWFRSNFADSTGGAVFGSTLLNCTLVGNRATLAGGGGARSSFTNCIIWSNSAPSGPNVTTDCTGRYNCVVLGAGPSWPNTSGADPEFREDYMIRPALKGSSWCINFGTNVPSLLSGRDLLGRPRVLYDRVDLGAIEYVAPLNDYDHDGRSDLTTYRQVGSDWRMWTLKSGSVTIQRWGPVSVPSGMVPVPGTYNGNGVFEPVCYREAEGKWYPYPFTESEQHGGPGMVPVWGDYNGDGIWDAAVYELSSGKWYILTPSLAILAWGLPWGYNGAIPVPGDFDGDGAYDLAVYDRVTARWYIRTLSGTVLAWNRQWGYNGAIPVSGDFNGDGRFDLGVYDPNLGKWYITGVPTTSAILVWGWTWGYAGARPVPGDFDGDGAYDLAVFDTSMATWYVREIISTTPLYWNFYMRPGTAVGMVTW